MKILALASVSMICSALPAQGIAQPSTPAASSLACGSMQPTESICRGAPGRTLPASEFAAANAARFQATEREKSDVRSYLGKSDCAGALQAAQAKGRSDLVDFVNTTCAKR